MPRKLAGSSSVAYYCRMAKSEELLAFQDHSIPYADTEDETSGGERRHFRRLESTESQKSRSLADCSWDLNSYSRIRSGIAQDISLDDIDTEPASAGENTSDMFTGKKYRHPGKLLSANTTSHRPGSKLESSTQLATPKKEKVKKRRDFRDIFCDGISRLIREVIYLLEGRKRDADGDEVEYGPIRYVPHSLETLAQKTNFSRDEIKSMYRTFKNECPTGVVYEETFKSIYSQFFPAGDASMYAHYIFNAFDHNQEGYICFEEFITSLSSLLRGKFEEKLQWAFKLYDVNQDGVITKEEMQDVVKSIHSLYGTRTDCTEYSYLEHANKVFCKMDSNGDGIVTFPEFVEACRSDETIVASMKIFDSDMRD